MGSWEWQTFIQDTMMINGTMVPEKKNGNRPWGPFLEAPGNYRAR